ncbi:MAG: undecaprenyl-diphosphate phosphatase [Deltaproteobacteria bacterium]|nr:undecaprenyl-diphosphate phosphatase [Deltaproteobacteria bacterium]
MPLWTAAILGIVEGLTEFLPISSTGHLILAAHLLGQHDEAAKSFEIVIQLGAILAVLVHFRRLLALRVAGLFRRDPASLRLLWVIVAAFLPTAVAGLLLRKVIKRHLFGPWPVALALIVGGVVMIAGEIALARRPRQELHELEAVTPRQGFVIGVAQCFSLWPGTSRAMTTLLAGRFLGLDPRTSAEVSFLLAIPVLGAATALDLYKDGRALLATSDARAALAVGFVTSFVVAWVAIGWFLGFLRKRGLQGFGWYRIALGIAVFLLIPRP